MKKYNLEPDSRIQLQFNTSVTEAGALLGNSRLA